MFTVILAVLAVVLAIATIVCAVHWAGNNLEVGACMRYMKEKGYALPSKGELMYIRDEIQLKN